MFSEEYAAAREATPDMAYETSMIVKVTVGVLLLVVVGGIFVVEIISVMIQVTSFKLTGKRVFLMASIHHHYEQLGWVEQKIVIRFWIVSIILALVALSSLKLR